MIHRGVGHVFAEVIDGSCDVRAGAVGTVQEFSDKGGKRECLFIQRLIRVGVEGDFSGHRYAYMQRG